MKDYIEDRALEIAKYIVREKATVRDTAKIFGVSKSTVQTDVRKLKGFLNTTLRLWCALKGSKILHPSQKGVLVI